MSNMCKQAEMAQLKQILHNNLHEVSILDSLNRTKQNQEQDLDRPRPKWVKVTYICRETRLVTKLFRNTQVEVAYTTNNNLENLLIFNVTGATLKYDKSSIYQLSCPTFYRK
jgi:hypothetical protein